jgi:hypothetical protein
MVAATPSVSNLQPSPPYFLFLGIATELVAVIVLVTMFGLAAPSRRRGARPGRQPCHLVRTHTHTALPPAAHPPLPYRTAPSSGCPTRSGASG